MSDETDDAKDPIVRALIAGRGLTIVDYATLLVGLDGVNSREQEISEITRGLKVLAKELENDHE